MLWLLSTPKPSRPCSGPLRLAPHASGRSGVTKSPRQHAARLRRLDIAASKGTLLLAIWLENCDCNNLGRSTT
jgi:hypothetical protein